MIACSKQGVLGPSLGRARNVEQISINELMSGSQKRGLHNSPVLEHWLKNKAKKVTRNANLRRRKCVPSTCQRKRTHPFQGNLSQGASANSGTPSAAQALCTSGARKNTNAMPKLYCVAATDLRSCDCTPKLPNSAVSAHTHTRPPGYSHSGSRLSLDHSQATPG